MKVEPAPTQLRVSLLIPLLNEEETLRQLVERTSSVLSQLTHVSYEIILVDDGSSDGSWPLILSLSQANKSVIGYRLRRNFGKATALALGAEMATGSVLVTLDADLQDDPIEIPRFLVKLDEGFDLVSGWKQDRKDSLSKTLASKFFNLTVRNITGVSMRDFNCGFKAARREVYRSIPLYGELHRFIPVLAEDIGYRVVEIPVIHHPRISGRSKYGIERIFRGFLDLLTVLTITRFSHRPSHLFGGLGILAGLVGGVYSPLSHHRVVSLSRPDRQSATPPVWDHADAAIGTAHHLRHVGRDALVSLTAPVICAFDRRGDYSNAKGHHASRSR